MKKITILALFYGIFISKLLSQDQFFTSTIVDHQGNKTEGYISNIFDTKAIKFKKTLKSKETIYTPAQIKGFVLSGSVFDSKIVRFRHYMPSSSYLGVVGDAPGLITVDTNKGFTTDTLFLKKIISGVVNLYEMHYTNNGQYFFVEKEGIIHEIPRKYFVNVVSDNARYNITNTGYRYNYTTYEYRTYIDTLAMVCNDKEFVKKMKPFDYSEKKIIATVGAYNRLKGIENGGFISQNLPKRFFYGFNIGQMPLVKDNLFKYAPISSTLLLKAYLLKPLVGVNRYASLKFGANYFNYTNKQLTSEIISASVGFRLASTSGAVRPYGEYSLSLSTQILNKNSLYTFFPSILEFGVLVPVKSVYLTVGANVTPFKYIEENGYKFLAWHIGVML